MNVNEDEIEIRIKNNKCPKCLSQLQSEKELNIRQCSVCGIIISNMNMESKKERTIANDK